jgi:hypothetical protein
MASEDSKAVPTEKMVDLKIDSGGMYIMCEHEQEFGFLFFLAWCRSA